MFRKKAVFMLVISIIISSFQTTVAQGKQPAVPDNDPSTVMIAGMRVSLDSPTQAVYGERPIDYTLTFANQIAPSARPVHFDSEIWHGGQAWGHESGPLEITGGEYYWSSYNQNGGTDWWRGDLPVGQSYTFRMPTETGYSLGTYEFVRATITVTVGSAIRTATLTRNLTLTTGSGSPSAFMSMANNDPPEFRQGQSRQMYLTMTAPYLTQFYWTFQSNNWTSSCGMQPLLPGQYQSGYINTWDPRYFWMYIPVGTPTGTCVVTGDIYLTSYSGAQEPIHFVQKFVILPPE